MSDISKIRNFAIIAHIDHGKSTLADRLLELTGTIEKREMREQFLDTMELEREKGITIKSKSVRMEWQGYILNLIDTPGHVDFTYEVSRSLAACEGAILVVDAVKGIQAQTLSNMNLAIEQNLEIIPVINKIDLPNARTDEVAQELKKLFGFSEDEIILISAKEGQNIDKVLEAVIQRIPNPKEKGRSFRGLILDSFYDNYQGIVATIRVFDGEISKNKIVYYLAQKAKSSVKEVGFFSPELKKTNFLKAGGVGYLVTGLKDPAMVQIGDTIAENERAEPLPGYKKPKQVVFVSFYPEDTDKYDNLKDALEKLHLNDSSFVFTPEEQKVLGRGFRLGFLGVLHLEIVRERIVREYGIELIVTTPNTEHKIIFKNGRESIIETASEYPEDPSMIEKILERWAKVEIITPSEHLNNITSLISEQRGVVLKSESLSIGQILITAEMPLSNLLVDFYDELKARSSGFASLNYKILDFRESDLVKLDILVAHEKVPAFVRLVPRKKAVSEGRYLARRLKDLIPRQMVAVPIQAAIGSDIIARETIKAFRKDVTAKLYGGDITRKDKLLKKQKKGKKKMEKLVYKKGLIKIPPKVFLEVLKR